MADNSKREQILLRLKNKIESLVSIKTVKRIQPSDISELQQYSAQQLPLLAMIGGVPIPVKHQRGRDNKLDVFLSELPVEIYIYFMNRVDPDSQLSSLLDDLWRCLFEDQLLDGLVNQMFILPKVEVAAWDPYVAFSVDLKYTYKHTIGGI